MVEKYDIEVPTNTNNYDSYSGISDIDTNYAGMNELYNTLNEASSNIDLDINKVKSLLSDLNANWTSTTATKSTKLLEEHMNYFSGYSQFYKNMADLLSQSENAYKNFDESFENETI